MTRLTDEERAELRARYLSWGRWALRVGGGVVGVFALSLGLAWGRARVIRRRRRGRQQNAMVPGGGPWGPRPAEASVTPSTRRGGPRGRS